MSLLLYSKIALCMCTQDEAFNTAKNCELMDINPNNCSSFTHSFVKRMQRRLAYGISLNPNISMKKMMSQITPKHMLNNKILLKLEKILYSIEINPYSAYPLSEPSVGCTVKNVLCLAGFTWMDTSQFPLSLPPTSLKCQNTLTLLSWHTTY